VLRLAIQLSTRQPDGGLADAGLLNLMLQAAYSKSL
jgi:hypothetical protein